jgi:hypothetical protein
MTSNTPSGAAGGASADARDAARHDCVARINEMLAEHNTQLAEFITFGNATREPIALMTQKADAKKRGKTVNFFASFCPMCGVSLVKDSL